MFETIIFMPATTFAIEVLRYFLYFEFHNICLGIYLPLRPLLCSPILSKKQNGLVKDLVIQGQSISTTILLGPDTILCVGMTTLSLWPQVLCPTIQGHVNTLTHLNTIYIETLLLCYNSSIVNTNVYFISYFLSSFFLNSGENVDLLSFFCYC